MAEIKMDTKGMRCPQPVLKVAARAPELKAGDLLEVIGDCHTFEDDIRKWCQRMGKTLLAVNRDGAVVTVRIQF
ncbi:MAG TPA: sulfurtransferase TusA family protein [Myxococcota bacterium]|nr:sulfurtransferase TusA family protein [Myxococcota bacterium]HRY95810.1 sulfurtransferase TusA family protein [Myxococcota bacterium]HSA23847.1 sulfurtransferase TusA family protein [Myxococcota bacterium]